MDIEEIICKTLAYLIFLFILFVLYELRKFIEKARKKKTTEVYLMQDEILERLLEEIKEVESNMKAEEIEELVKKILKNSKVNPITSERITLKVKRKKMEDNVRNKLYNTERETERIFE